MPLDWDIKKNGVSIKSKVSQFEIRASKGAYVRELTLYVKDPSFYDDLDFSSVPESPEIEVLTKTGTTWVSQGLFYIEEPLIRADYRQMVLDGIWGRSKTAVLGEPFADRISRVWDEDTSFYAIVLEVLERSGISVEFEVNDYPIYANSYQARLLYPIDIVSELAKFAGAYVSTDASGKLVIKREIFHPSGEDITVTDADILSLDERVEFPRFGNRIKIGTAGRGAGLSVSLHALGSSDCLPPDSSVSGVLLAQVTNHDGSPAEDNLIVRWEAEDGISLAENATATGTYTLEDQIHKAQNYYQVRVDFPISDVIGVWAYNDAGHLRNLYDPATDSFSGRTITLFKPLDYCDQQLRITYKTAGVAVNRITPGDVPKDVKVRASIYGATASITVKIGNPCACGSSLNMRVTPNSGTVCLGLAAGILVWGEINSLPAIGDVRLRIKEGCGELSSKNKKFKSVTIKNEKATVKNIVKGVSQVECDITPADNPTPEVYLASDTAKNNNLYSSHSGKIIDLNQNLESDTEVVVDYTALGATAVTWMTDSESSECEAIIEAFMEDGHEAGLHATVRVNARDCTVPTTPPDENEETSPYDPENLGGWDNSSGDSDGIDLGDLGKPKKKDQHAMLGGPCGPEYTKRNRKITGTEPESDSDAKRFDVGPGMPCPPECGCDELCESEITAFGNTQDYSETLSEQAIAEGHEKGTAAYYEAMGRLHDEHKNECIEKCNQAVEEYCECVITGPDQLDPGEVATYTNDSGEETTFTAPSDCCGCMEVQVGSNPYCKKKVRCSNGQWTADPPGSYGECFTTPDCVGAKVTGDACSWKMCCTWTESINNSCTEGDCGCGCNAVPGSTKCCENSELASGEWVCP